jgi:hypothetical protein
MRLQVRPEGVDYNDRAQGASLPLRLKLFRLLGKQAWIPRGRNQLLRTLWNPGTRRSFSFEVDFFGMRYPGNMSEYIDWQVFAYRAYARSELTLLAALADRLRDRRNRSHSSTSARTWAITPSS